MDQRMIVFILCCGIIIAASMCLCYFIYSLVLIDAKARGLERPRLWAFLSLSGQSGGGLLLYFFKRRKYEVHLTRQEQVAMDQLKRKIFAIFFVEFVAIGFFVFSILP